MEDGDVLEYAVDNGIFSESNLEDRDINDVRDDVIDTIYTWIHSRNGQLVKMVSLTFWLAMMGEK